MSTTEMIQPEEEPIRQSAVGLVAEAKGLLVVDEPSFKTAGEIQSKLRSGIKGIEGFFAPMKTAAHAAWKAVCKREAEVLDPVQAAYDDLGERAGDWYMQEKRKRDEEARLQRIEMEKEQRKAQEEQRKAEELARKKKLPPPPPPAPIAPPPPVAEIAKVSGASTRTKWEFEITDAAKIPREYMIPDEKKIRGVVNAMKGSTKIPGVLVFETALVSGRA